MKNDILQKFKETPNRIISYYVGGNLQSKQCLLFFNGLYIGNGAWVKQQRYPYFRDNYKLIFIDYPGVGDSVEKGDGEIGFEDIVNDIKAIVDEESYEEMYIIGYSVGGMIGLWFTYRFQNSINGLILLNSGVKTNIYIEKMIHGLLSLMDEGASLKNIFRFIYPWNHSKEYLEKTSDVEKSVLQNYAEYNRNIKAFKMLLMAIRNRPNLAIVLDKISVPTLVVSSENDFVFPKPFQEEIISRVKHSTHYVIPNCGHASFIEKYEEVNRCMELHLKALLNES